MTPPVFRFAPSPNGWLHLGHALSALQNEAEARRLGGRLLLRIEDIDRGRCRPAFEAGIIADMEWLGIAFERPVWRQSERMAHYQAALERLAALGLTYRCTCSRSDVRQAAGAAAAADPDGAPLYPGACRGIDRSAAIADGAPFAIRLDMRQALASAGPDLAYTRFAPDGREQKVAAEPARWGDVVLARKETPTSYHLAVVVDDAAQGVSHVVRGQDLEAATDIHALLQRLLGLPTPRYQFHPLIRDEADAKLSKSAGAPALSELRQAGLTGADIRARLGFPALQDCTPST